MPNNFKKMICVSLLTIGFATATHVQAAAINLTTPGLEYSGGSYTLGFRFSVNANTTITSLGIYDSGADGLASTGQVGLWNTTGTLLTSAIVPTGTAGELDGLFRYVNISGFNLLTGTDYIIGAYTTDLASSLGTGQGGTGSIDPNVNIAFDQYSNFNGAFSFPSITDSRAGGAWLGANFRTGATEVPEPASLLLVGLGLTGLCLGRRRKQT